MNGGMMVEGLDELIEDLDRLQSFFFDGSREIFKQRTLSAHEKVSYNMIISPMKRRSGLLAKSLKTRLTGSTINDLKAGIYTSRFVNGKEVKYAPLHEFGDTIRAKNAYKNVPGGPYLNIPTRDNQTPSGVMRYSPKYVFQNMGGYIVGRGVYVPVTVSGGVNDAVETLGIRMFSLVREVTIKPQLGMRKAMANEVPTLLSQMRDLRMMQ